MRYRIPILVFNTALGEKHYYGPLYFVDFKSFHSKYYSDCINLIQVDVEDFYTIKIENIKTQIIHSNKKKKKHENILISVFENQTLHRPPSKLRFVHCTLPTDPIFDENIL